MIRSYSFQNPRAFPMACATFETTAQKTLGTLACRDIWWSSFRWNASLKITSNFNPRLIGGGRLTPPSRIFAIAKNEQRIDVKLCRPSHTTI